MEKLITFDQLERYPLEMQQQEFPLHWNEVDALNTFLFAIPGYIIDLDIFSHWASVATDEECKKQPFLHHNSSDTLESQAVFLALAPLHLAETGSGDAGSPHGDNPQEFVFSAVIVFVHPWQKLSMIANGVDNLLARYELVIQDPHLNGWGILCDLLRFDVGTFFPCLAHSSYLVLPVEVVGPEVPPLL